METRTGRKIKIDYFNCLALFYSYFNILEKPPFSMRSVEIQCCIHMDLFLGRINPWFTLHMIRMSHLIRMDVNHLQSRYECLTWLTWNCRQSGFTCYGQRHYTKFTLNWTKFFTLQFEVSLNLFVEFAEFIDKTICHYSKRAQTCYLLY